MADNAMSVAAVAEQPAEFPQRARDVPVTELMNAIPDTPSRDALIKSLVDAERARIDFNQDYRLARMFALSGQFDELKGKTPDQAVAAAMVKVQLGRSWGLEPADAVRFIYFTGGRPALENEIIASKLLDSGFAWDIQWIEDAVTHKGRQYKKCIGCTLWVKVWSEKDRAYLPLLDRNGNQVSESFTEFDADNATIYEKGQTIPLSQKWNYKSWGRDMYYWRAISRVRKYHATNVLRGAVARAEIFDVPLEEGGGGELPETADAPPEPAPEEQEQAKPIGLREQALRQAELLDTKPEPKREYPG